MTVVTPDTLTEAFCMCFLQSLKDIPRQRLHYAQPLPSNDESVPLQELLPSNNEISH
jgi:hypothetical protein